MRRLAVLVAALAVLAGCTGESDAEPQAPTTADGTVLSLDWPVAADLTPVAAPDVPEGFDPARYEEMVDALTRWAQATTVDPDVRSSDDPAAAVAALVPDAIGGQIESAAKDSTAPRLSAATVFSDDTEVIGDPQVTTAWKVETTEDEGGAPAMRLMLQTRAAYTVRDGDGPERTIGVLRVHELVTREGASGELGIGFSWQEFGASDCTVATSDALRPDAATADVSDELATFAGIGSGTALTMPELPAEDTVDQDYLDRCKRGTA